MAVRAFTKVLVKQGQSLLDGLLGKSYLPRVKLPKQKTVNVADIAAKASKCPTQPVARESWLRQYAWKTLASDLRKRAAWQFSGRAGGRLAEGQRWLLFPAYGFLGLGLASKPVSADEVDTGFDTVTNQIKGMFEKDAGRNADADSPCGRLIARGSRVALYKLDTPTPDVDEKKQESCEEIAEIAEDTEIYEEAEESLPEEESDDKVSFECVKPLPSDAPTCVNVNFTTDDGRSFSVAINVAPGETHPVALDSVSIDGKVTKYCNPSVKIERMIGEAMHESTIQERSLEEKEMSDYLAPYESLTSQSIEVISEGPSIVSDVLSEASVPALDPCMPILSYDHNAMGITTDRSQSLASDITIIDDTMELDLAFPDLEEPVFLDDLADDPLRDLTFVNHYEAINYLQTSNDGAYLLMTYFPEATDEDMLTSLSLPDTGENLWDAYEEIFHGKTPASKQDEAVKSDAATAQCKEDAQDDRQGSGSFHKLSTSEITEARKLEEMSCAQPEPGGGKLEMTENVEAVGENTAEIYVEVSQKKPARNEENWINRVPSTNLPTSHPNLALLPSGGQPTPDTEEAKTLQEELTTSTLGLLESVVLFTQISDAVAHLDQQGLVVRDLSSADVFIAGESPWRSAVLAVDPARLYDKICPRHLSYRDAVKSHGSACDQPKMIPLAHEPGFSDESSVIRSLALLGLELFGARSPLANQSEEQTRVWTYPAHVPDVFMRLLDAMMKSNAHKVFSASLLSYSLHLLLWCPQSYLQDRDPVTCKAQVMRWLSTFSAVTFLKSRSSDNDVKVNEEVKQQMKLTFLMTLDGIILSNAVKVVQTVI